MSDGLKRYSVVMPVAGAVEVIVDASNEEEARIAAYEAVDFRMETGHTTECLEIDVYSEISRGNVLYAPQNEIEIEELSDDR